MQDLFRAIDPLTFFAEAAMPDTSLHRECLAWIGGNATSGELAFFFSLCRKGAQLAQDRHGPIAHDLQLLDRYAPNLREPSREVALNELPARNTLVMTRGYILEQIARLRHRQDASSPNWQHDNPPYVAIPLYLYEEITHQHLWNRNPARYDVMTEYLLNLAIQRELAAPVPNPDTLSQLYRDSRMESDTAVHLHSAEASLRADARLAADYAERFHGHPRSHAA